MAIFPSIRQTLTSYHVPGTGSAVAGLITPPCCHPFREGRRASTVAPHTLTPLANGDIRGDSGPEREKHRACFKRGGGEHLSEEAVCFGLSLAGKGGHPGKELEVEHPCRKESRGRPGAGRTGPTRTERMGHLGRVLSGRRAVPGRSGPAVCLPLSCGVP